MLVGWDQQAEKPAVTIVSNQYFDLKMLNLNSLSPKIPFSLITDFIQPKSELVL